MKARAWSAETVAAVGVLRRLVERGTGTVAFGEAVVLNAAQHLLGIVPARRVLGPGTCPGFRGTGNPRFVSVRCADCGKTRDDHRRWNDPEEA